MVTSVRLDSQTERKLSRLARKTGKSKSELIRDAINRLSSQEAADEGDATAYERLADFVGAVNLGPGARAARSEEILRSLFAAKRARR